MSRHKHTCPDCGKTFPCPFGPLCGNPSGRRQWCEVCVWARWAREDARYEHEQSPEDYEPNPYDGTYSEE
jgi:hypothetical protein